MKITIVWKLTSCNLLTIYLSYDVTSPTTVIFIFRAVITWVSHNLKIFICDWIFVGITKVYLIVKPEYHEYPLRLDIFN
jgi:hypothetical protein